MQFERIRQKQRTRDALIAAARDLVAQGMSPTVEDAANAASISRTTAYRYFRRQEDLLAVAHPETHLATMLPAKNAPSDPEERLVLVMQRFTELVAETEVQQRTMLRLSLERRSSSAVEEKKNAPPLPLRQGRAIAWIEEALSPLEGTLTRAEIRRLVLAIRSATGIEAMVWLTDVAGLSRAKAIASMRWSAVALLRGALVRD